jgi:hypothetical protein
MDNLDLINQSPLSKIEVNQTKRYIQITWLKQPQSEDFRKEAHALTEYILSGNMNKVLYDVRKRYYLELGDQNLVDGRDFPGPFEENSPVCLCNKSCGARNEGCL